MTTSLVAAPAAAVIATAAVVGGWAPVNAVHAETVLPVEAFARPGETLTVHYANGRIVHVNYLDQRGPSPVRDCLGHGDRLAYALDRLA
jgi:hypothetical protein